MVDRAAKNQEISSAAERITLPFHLFDNGVRL